MAIPEGYRLLTSADIGKVFGVDLEPSIFIDTSATLTNSIITASCVRLDSYNDFILGAYIEDGFEYQIQFRYETQYATHFVQFGEFYQDIVDNINAISNINGTITAVGYSNDDNWNNWLYVKDIEVADPYSIKIKNKEGIKLLTKDKDIHFDDDVKITIDESLLGGGEAKKYNFTLYQDIDTGGNSDQYYSVDGGAFEVVPYADNSVSLTGNTLVIFSKNYRTTDVYVTGGSFVGIKYKTSSTRYYVVVVTITEDNAEVHFNTYD